MISIFKNSLFFAGILSVHVQAGDFEKAIDRLAKTSQVSVQIMDLDRGAEVFSKNKDLPLNPASSIKVLTAVTALKHLGPDYVFQTKIYQTSKQNLCIESGGDPSFVMEDMWLWVKRLQRKGVKNLGALVQYDSSHFDEEFYPEDRNSKDSERAYNSPLASLNFNYNTITTFVNPAAKVGDLARVELDFDFPFIQVQNKVKTVKGSGSDIRFDKNSAGKTETVLVTGTIGLDSPEWKKPFRVQKPNEAFVSALIRTAKDLGVSGASDVKIEKVSRCEGDLLDTWSSKPLYQIVGLMNKYSNNFIADILVKEIGRKVKSLKTGTTESGLQVLSEELAYFGIGKTKGRNVVSGSGLTDDNRLSAEDFSKIVRKVFQESPYFPEFAASLPLAGIDGTLIRKYRKTEIEAVFRGKTGSLTGVQSLVGLYPVAPGRWYVVSILVNGGGVIPEQDLAHFLGRLGAREARVQSN